MAERIVLGPYPVEVDAGALATFADAVRAPADDIPLTFAIRWLAHPDVRAAILTLVQPDEIAVHEEQVFEFGAPLAPGGRYNLRAELERTDGPARIGISARADVAGNVVLTMRTVLRLLSTAALPAGPAIARQAAQQ